MTNTPINILIVDDEPKNLTVLETLLDDPDYRIVRAESADEALLALVAEEFALLILDIHMPGMSGIELAQIIKERKKTSRVPIIFLTAYYNDDQHVLDGYETGAVDYLHKPVNAAILRSKVSVFSELHRKNRELALANREMLAEVSERRLAEQRLAEMNDTLEQRVRERTQALRTSEEQFRGLLESAPDAMVIVDRAGIIALANMQTERLFGYRREELLGQRAEMIFPTRLRGPEDKHLRDIVAESQSNYLSTGQDLLGQRHDGIEFPMEIALRSIETKEGLLVFAAIRDITDRKRIEDELRDADRRKDEFLATLAHELRNPLAPIRNGLQLIRMAEANGIIEQARSMMDRQLTQLVRLVDDLLDVSRVTSGKLELRHARAELRTVIDAAVETSRPAIESESHKLIVDIPSEPIWVNADTTRLAQVVSNLLNNSAKYMHRGGQIRLTVRCEDDVAIVSVADDGIGIPPAMLIKVFEMFTQVDRALEKTTGGLGIGLSLVKGLVEMHGGTIEARSEGEGRGSEFIVRLPIELSTNHNDEPPNSEEHDRSPYSRILVADDNVDAANSLGKLLELLGHDVSTAYDGLQAVEVAETFHPQMIFLDIGMPKLNGYEAARCIRAKAWGQDAVLIALTGWGQEDDIKKSLDAGFDHHFVKPLEISVLRQVLAGLIATTS